VEFELRDEANNLVDSGKTDMNGTLEFDNLPYGKYKLAETEADGYVIEQPVRDVTIEGPLTQLTIENRKEVRDVKLVKYNAGKTKTLPGAVFELWAWNGNIDLLTNKEIYELVQGIPAADLTTDANGELLLMNLAPNKYQLVEIKAPSGYKPDAEPVEFEIQADQTAVIIVEKTNQLLPAQNPILPVTEEPAEEEEPEEPAGEAADEPAGPADQTETLTPDVTPEEPELPDQVTETPENTPKEGKVEVPAEGKVMLSTPPKNGTVQVHVDGTWKYTPNEGFVGTDEFVIKVIGKAGREEEVRVSMNVLALPQGVTALPKTGEASPWPYVAGGFGLVLLGAVQLVRNSRRWAKD